MKFGLMLRLQALLICLLLISITVSAKQLQPQLQTDSSVTAESVVIDFGEPVEFNYQAVAPAGKLGADYFEGKAVAAADSGETGIRVVLKNDSVIGKGILCGKTFEVLSAVSIESGSIFVKVKKFTTYAVEKNGNKLTITFNKDGRKIIAQLADGLSLENEQLTTAAGKALVYVLNIDAEKYNFLPVTGKGTKEALTTVSASVLQNGAVAGINGNYFGANGLLYTSAKINGSVISNCDYQRTAIGFTDSGAAVINPVFYSGSVTLPNSWQIKIDSVNRIGAGVLGYADWNCPVNSTGTKSGDVTEVVVRKGIVTAVSDSGNSAIPPDGYVLIAKTYMRSVFQKLQPGDNLNVKLSFGKEFDACGNVLEAGPRLVRNGKQFVTKVEERFQPDIAIGRAPRTAVGIKNDGSLILVVVDGRRADSVGVTLEELADYLISKGAVDAVNFDGGGSSEMVINGNIVNRPTDGSERRCGTCLLVLSKQ